MSDLWILQRQGGAIYAIGDKIHAPPPATLYVGETDRPDKERGHEHGVVSHADSIKCHSMAPFEVELPPSNTTTTTKMSQIIIDSLISIHDSYFNFCIAKDTTAKNPPEQQNCQQMILMQFFNHFFHQIVLDTTSVFCIKFAVSAAYKSLRNGDAVIIC